ncbi:MAG: hypothetical protein JWM89_1807 [Acidimicrobiales bacterium]|nr:hypothetical protein [Acidimicrobiales bacterium]
MRDRSREAATHDGAMLALFVGAAPSAAIAIPDGEPAADLHVALAFLGPDTAQLDITAEQVAAVAKAVAADTPPLTGTTGGSGRFTGSHKDGLDAVWLVPDVVGLDELRRRIVDGLEAIGVAVDNSHGFTPHITVAYVPAGDDSPTIDPTPVELSFDELTLAWAGDRTTFPFGGDPVTKKKILQFEMAAGRASEAFPGDRTYGDVRELLEKALREQFGNSTTRWVYPRDFTETEVIYTVEGDSQMGYFKVGYSMADDGTITFTDAPIEVEEHRTFEPVVKTSSTVAAPTPAPATTAVARTTAATEAHQYVVGRVLEAKGVDETGGRVFRVQILEYGVSKNGVRYTEAVVAAAAPLYEGAKAFDRHRTTAELASSTISGLVGGYRNVEATATGLEADLHLLPSAVHTAEAFDASLEAEAAGLQPLVGLSHDIAHSTKESVEGGRKIKESTAIRMVFSVDVVADPSAGGRVTRTVAGGICDTELPEEINMTTLAELLAGASDEDKAAFQSLLGDATAAATSTSTPAPGGATTTTSESVATYDPAAPSGRMLIRSAVADSGIGEGLTESITAELGDRFTEADLTRVIETTKRVGERFEAAGMRPGVPHIQVTKEAIDKKVERLDRTLEGNYSEGYPSIKLAYADIAGLATMDALSPELAFEILRESAMGARIEGKRQTESINTGTWGQIFGDALHRSLVKEYTGNDFQAWRDLVSTIVPRMDFRTNHVVRMGGYGALPTVAEGDPYTALTSPPDEEATYALAKKGGTEDLTIEAIANDDMGAIRRIPKALARAAALTLYRFVIDTLMASNPTIYDAVALFHASHANTTATALLDRDNLAAVRTKMVKQAAYGVAADVLGVTPKYLWVPADLERTAWELCTSAVAVTADSNATIPNFNQGMLPRVVPHWTDANDWFVTADPNSIETIELGFFNGKQDPELFVQDDPKTGAVFTNDKITYKIRHIYAGAVAEYRGFQRATNA